MRHIERSALARVFLARGDARDAVSVLDDLLSAADAARNIGPAIEALSLLAVGREAMGDSGQAVAALLRALSLAHPGGYLRIFLDEGPAITGLVQRIADEPRQRDLAASWGVPREYVERILAAFSSAAGPVQAMPPPGSAVAPLVEPLSDRELEVLRLLAAGLSAPEIAARLFIADSTVRSHIKSIYGKLDAHGRVEAIARARSLRLI